LRDGSKKRKQAVTQRLINAVTVLVKSAQISLSGYEELSRRLKGRVRLSERGTKENDSVLVAEEREEAVTISRVMQRERVRFSVC
jgi:hypothetical protein